MKIKKLLILAVLGLIGTASLNVHAFVLSNETGETTEIKVTYYHSNHSESHVLEDNTQKTIGFYIEPGGWVNPKLYRQPAARPPKSIYIKGTETPLYTFEKSFSDHPNITVTRSGETYAASADQQAE